MGRLVNVVLPSGRVVAVDEEVANASRLARPDVAQEAAPQTEELNASRSSGIAEGVKAAAEGFSDTVTGGLAGAVHGALDPDYARNSQIRAQNRGNLRGLGEAAGYLVPILGEEGGAAGAIAENTAPALASRLGAATTEALGGGTAAKVAGRALEGAAIGAQTRVVDTNVSGDRLTVEGLVEDAGVGALIGVGQGALLDKVSSMTWNAKKRAAEAAIEQTEFQENRATAALAEKSKAIFDKESPATPVWNDFTDFAEQQRKSALDVKKGVEKQAREYNAWVDPATAPRTLKSAIAEVEKARNDILSQINETPYGREVGAAADAHTAARESYVQDSEKAMTLLSSTEKWPATLQKVDSAIDQVYNRYTLPEAERTYKPKLIGYTGELNPETGIFEKGDAVRTATEKPPISPELDADLQEFARRRSMITKMKDGGYRIDGGHWTPDASVPPDPLGALRELHKLRDDFTGVLGRGEMRDFRSVKFPDLPAVPKEVPEFAMPGMQGDTGELPKLSSAARDLSDSAAKARKLLREGKFQEATDELRSLRKKMQFAGLNDVSLPNIPHPPPPYPVVPEKISLPDNLRAFARMKPETVAEIANNLDDHTKDAFFKVYQHLDLQGAQDGTEAMIGAHRELGRYIKAVDSMDAISAKAAGGDAQSGRFLKWLRENLKASAKYSVARTVDKALNHGFAGAVGRVFAGQVAGMAMGQVENAVLGRDDFSTVGGLMAMGREGFRMKISNLIAKYGDSVATGGAKIAPLMTHLGTGFVTGDRDPETDPRKQAVNRIAEIRGLNLTAKDAMYTAVQPLMGHPSDVAWKVHATVVQALQHLSDKAPLDPGINQKMGRSAWTPSYRDARSYAARIEAVKDPMGSLQRLLAGGGDPAAADTLWTLYPAMMNQAAAEIVTAANFRTLSMQQASAYSRVFRVPLTGFQQPQVIAAIQGMYMQRVAQGVSAGQQPAPQGPGRPAKVRNRAAGSSVSALISQE